MKAAYDVGINFFDCKPALTVMVEVVIELTMMGLQVQRDTKAVRARKLWETALNTTAGSETTT